MMTRYLPFAAVSLLALGSTFAAPQEEMTMEEATAAFASQLSFETGAVEVASGKATIQLPEGWAMLGPRDARRVVEEFWGNPEDSSTLAFLDPPSAEGRLMSDYGIIISVDDSGFIEDDDAGDYDYDELLEAMKSDTAASNEERMAAGYGSVELVGWAATPFYDEADKKLHWAKEIRFDGSEETTVNYDVRVLGRYGYLTLQAVAPMSAFDQVDPGMRTILGATDFTDGNRYGDFDSSIDKVAAVGIAGLIGGKLAAKAGLFVVLAKFGKFIILGIIGLFVALKRFVFGGGKDKNPYAPDDDQGDETPAEA